MTDISKNYFYVHNDDCHSGIFILREDEYKHAVKVLRVREGDIISAVDGAGTEYLGEIKEFSHKHKSLRCTVLKKRRMPNEPLRNVILLQAIIKGDRQDYLIEKSVEIGVNSIIPVETSRCVAKGTKQKTARWRRIALAAMKQSGRSVLPDIPETLAWEATLESLPRNSAKLILHMQSRTEFHRAVADIPPEKKSAPAVIAVGPEGDFTDEEIKIAEKHGFIPVTLGQRRLRAETAGITALSVIISGS